MKNSIPEGWHYVGDKNLEHGGFFWCVSSAAPLEIYCVSVIPLSDAGGPDNMYRILDGSFTLPDERMSEARRSGGTNPEDASLERDVTDLYHYKGLEGEMYNYVVRVGREDPMWNGIGQQPEPDHILPGNAKILNFMIRDHIHSSDVIQDWDAVEAEYNAGSAGSHLKP